MLPPEEEQEEAGEARTSINLIVAKLEAAAASLFLRGPIWSKFNLALYMDHLLGIGMSIV